MSLPSPDRRTDATRTAIIDVAERLFAERGVSTVALREVSVAAGQRNHSAAQYHFGSREGLVDAIIEARSAAIDARRQVMLAQQDATAGSAPERIGRLVEVLVRPWAECLLAAGESHYLRFLARCMDEPQMRRSWRTAHTDPPAVRETNERLREELTALPAAVVLRRLEWLSSVSLNVLADEERRASHDPVEVEQVVADLVAMLSGLLQQPG